MYYYPAPPSSSPPPPLSPTPALLLPSPLSSSLYLSPSSFSSSPYLSPHPPPFTPPLPFSPSFPPLSPTPHLPISAMAQGFPSQLTSFEVQYIPDTRVGFDGFVVFTLSWAKPAGEWVEPGSRAVLCWILADQFPMCKNEVIQDLQFRHHLRKKLKT